MKVLLIGNYAPDRQESMLRYAQMLRAGLVEAGYQVTLAVPRPVLNCSAAGRHPVSGSGLAISTRWCSVPRIFAGRHGRLMSFTSAITVTRSTFSKSRANRTW